MALSGVKGCWVVGGPAVLMGCAWGVELGTELLMSESEDWVKVKFENLGDSATGGGRMTGLIL